MSNTKPSPVLTQVVSIIKNAVADIKTEYPSAGTAIMKDGNDTIKLEQKGDDGGSIDTIFITDPRDIIFSEDLLPVLKDLQNATIVVNNLEVETCLVLETAKEAFDELSSSYEFVKTTERANTKLTSAFKFDKHAFEVTITNDGDQIIVEADLDKVTDQAVKTVIAGDAAKVQKALHGMYKDAK
ncbi:MAG: hypothetical protein V4687_11665 [Bacteroidota bacterium]